MKFFDWLKSIRARRERVLKEPARPEGAIPPRTRETSRQTQAQAAAHQNYPKKRRYKRYVVEGMEISAKMIFAEMVELSNISIGGACIVTKKDLRPGDNIIIKITDENIDRPIKCKVVWESEVDDKDKERTRFGTFNKAGIKFEEIKPDTLVKLKDYMRGSGIPNAEKLGEEYMPSALRFKVYKNEKAIMNYPMMYPVKKISLGGMLVEADREFKVEQRYPMAIYLPQDTLPIKIHGRIASLIPVEKKNRYDIGIEFLDLSVTDRSKLSRLFSQL